MQMIGISTIVIFIAMILIPLAFFFFLSQNSPDISFGLKEIIFSLVFGILATSFLFWTKSLTYTNPYLGTIIGLLTLVGLEYALFLKYSGGFTIIFSLISIVVVLVYFGMNFLQGLRLRNSKEEDIDSI